MFLNVDQLEKQLDKDEFQEIGSMAAFKVLETQFQMFIKSRIYLDDEYVIMTRKYFLEYTQLEIPKFRDTLIQHMKSIKKLIDERAQHKREYDSRVNERQMLTTEEKVDTSNALDASLVDTKNSGTESAEQDTRQQHTEQPEFNNEGEVDQNAEQCHDTRPLPAKLTNNQTTELSNQSLASENICLKKIVAQFQKDFSRMEAHCVNLELKYQHQALKEGQHGQFSKVKSKEAKPLFASQVDVNNDLSKPVTTHYFPKGKEYACTKPHHMIAPGASRYSSNDMVHNHYLEEAKKKTQESGRNSRPSVMPSARSQSITNEHSRISRNFSDSKHFVCSTCQKCVFNANHDSCVTKFLNEVNSRAKVPSHKTTNRNKPVKQISVAKKPERQIPTGHRFSIKKTSVVHEKTKTPRSCLRWKPTGRIVKTIGLRWVPTGKIFTSSTNTVDSEPPHGYNTDITNLYECIQTFDSSAGTSKNVQEEQNLNLSAGTPSNLKKERIKACIKENVISGRPTLHGTTLIQEISARASQGIRCLLTF
ncbi:hypothetical protein Tco_0237151 [Tanacetum coccineum]